MTRLVSITLNTFRQTLRQPIFGIIVLATLGALAMAPSVTGWTLDDDNKLLRDLGLSTLLIQGLFLAAFGAAGVVSVEIEDRTVLTVAAKPVARWLFICGKFLGVLGALLLAHYIALLGLLLTLRHGVLQTASEKSDLTVILAGPGMVLLVMLAAGLLNYTLDWKFLSTTVVLVALGLSLGCFVLLFVNRDFGLRSYEVTQDVPGLPAEIKNPDQAFAGIISYRDETETASTETKGKIIRREWLGPISDADRAKLKSLSTDIAYNYNIDFLIEKTRKLVTLQVLKAAILLIGVLAILTGFAVAVSTRFGTAWTLFATVLLLMAGLVADHYLQPLAATGGMAAKVAAAAVPNFQFFWLIDAVSEDNVIPWSYLGRCLAYAAVYSGSLLAIGAALFETRELG